VNNPGHFIMGYYFPFLLIVFGVLTFFYLKRMSALHVRTAPLPLGTILIGAGVIVAVSWWYGIFIMVTGGILVVGDAISRMKYMWRIFLHR
jgi:hypothetical protein